MTRSITITSLLAIIFLAMVVPAQAGVLDGKVFVGQNGIIGKSDSEDDTIKFENGKFYSYGCGEYGFGEAPYTMHSEGDTVFFTADIYSDKWGRITYSGYVRGDALEATYMWFNTNKYAMPEQVKWWKGTMQK